MSYASIFKNVPDVLSQPAGMAAIASIGIHGAIAFILPLMPIDYKPKPVRLSKAVGVLQFSRSEQQRLPKTSIAPKVALQTQIPTPNINYTSPKLITLPPIPSNSSTLPILPQLPKSTFNDPTNSLPIFDSGSIYRPYTFTNPILPRVRSIYNLPDIPNYANPRTWKSSNTSPTIVSINSNKPSTAERTAKNKTISFTSQELMAPVKSIFRPGGNYAIATTGGFQEFKLQSPQKNDVVSSNKVPKNKTAILNSHQDLRHRIIKKYPLSREETLIQKVIPTNKTVLHGDIKGILVMEPEGKVIDIVFQSDQPLSPLQMVVVRRHFLKNPPPATKNLSYYPFKLSLKYISNISHASEQHLIPRSPHTSLGEKLRKHTRQKEIFSSQPVKIKTTSRIFALPNKPYTNTNNSLTASSMINNQQNSLSNQPVKIKTTSRIFAVQNNQQAADDKSNNKKLINQLRQVREKRQNKNK
ncbi:hypothetical protein RINTHH_190 [Richelia intracellularis HH01]|mgnify:CR=1 FL=1|jgi:hypothetical protein|uniref:Uncharacterized protein n=1 Tax=Richelia intracellularis HH01 TaxID=1165094 RepID=M1WQ46_9NOST|nr:hypothetical protein [Richelia intracellularis]CCH66174.1 hypothetical protein RINTHH_190 [Richelia intracellularis HH01]